MHFRRRVFGLQCACQAFVLHDALWDRTDGLLDTLALECLTTCLDLMQDIEKITSSLLDSLPISDEQKYEMSGAVEGVSGLPLQMGLYSSMMEKMLI